MGQAEPDVFPERFMREALKEAKKAYAQNEVPIGAIVEQRGRIVGRGYNRTESEKDPTAHAELLAIREAAKTLGGWRLVDCNLYVTAEPCAMCAGAIVWSRIVHLYIGTPDPKAGACCSLMRIPQDERLNHQVEMTVGLLEEECRGLMKQFFRDLRIQKKQERYEKKHQEELE